MMFYQAYTGKAFDFTPVELSWFNPANIPDFGTFAAGICLSLFTFWGWDVTLTMSEETKGSKSTPGKVATMTVVIIILIYLFIAIGAIVYAGVGTGELGLGNPGIQENVFFAVAGPFMGPAAILTLLGMMICFYYGLTALSCVWYFRKQWFTSAYNFFYKFLFPLVGGLVLALLFFSTLINSMDPSFGSGSETGGKEGAPIVTISAGG
jgi:amino acid transporter